MSVTLRDVAREAGVSASAVSRAFTDGAPIAAGTRARIRAVADKLGYRPNPLAAALTTGRTGLVGLVVDDPAQPLTSALLAALAPALSEAGHHPLVMPLGNRKPALLAAQFRRYAADAVIVVAPALAPSAAQALGGGRVPVLHVLARAHNAPPLGQVGINDTLLGRQAAQTLHGRGYRHVAFVGGPERAMPTLGRALGFRTGAERLGMTVTALHAEGAGHAEGLAAGTQLLAAAERPEAIFAQNDLMAAGVIDAARALGVNLPADLGVLGAEDLPHAALPGYAITTFALPLAEMAEATVIQLRAALADPASVPAPAILACRLVERTSLRPLP